MNAVTHFPAPVSDRVYREVTELLFTEAQLLDEGRLKQWLELLDTQIRYRLAAPALSVRGPGTDTHEGQTLLMDETLGSFKARVQQLTTPAFTITENPRPFTRRFVTNIFIDPGAAEGPFHVRSNVLVYRSRGTQMEPHLFSMSRRDVWQRIAGELRLLRRDAQLDESVLSARNITALW